MHLDLYVKYICRQSRVNSAICCVSRYTILENIYYTLYRNIHPSDPDTSHIEPSMHQTSDSWSPPTPDAVTQENYSNFLRTQAPALLSPGRWVLRHWHWVDLKNFLGTRHFSHPLNRLARTCIEMYTITTLLTAPPPTYPIWSNWL